MSLFKRKKKVSDVDVEIFVEILQDMIDEDLGLLDTDDNDDEFYDYDSDEFDEDEIPEGCLACGGPYPLCIDGCALFEED